MVIKDGIAANPELTWCDTSRRGDMAMTVWADPVGNDRIMIGTIRTRPSRTTIAHSATVGQGALPDLTPSD
jgi:alkaline phosphatase D